MRWQCQRLHGQACARPGRFSIQRVDSIGQWQNTQSPRPLTTAVARFLVPALGPAPPDVFQLRDRSGIRASTCASPMMRRRPGAAADDSSRRAAGRSGTNGQERGDVNPRLRSRNDVLAVSGRQHVQARAPENYAVTTSLHASAPTTVRSGHGASNDLRLDHERSTPVAHSTHI
jgi:hypothetical protein